MRTAIKSLRHKLGDSVSEPVWNRLRHGAGYRMLPPFLAGSFAVTEPLADLGRHSAQQARGRGNVEFL